MRRARRSSLPFSRTVIAVVAIAGVAAIVESGCGSRGPLDDTPYPSDAALEAADVSVDVAPDVVGTTDGSPSDGGIIACGSCLLGTCGATIFACIQAEGCREILQCVTSECAGGSGGLSPACLFQCAGSDPNGALQVLELFTCVTGKCGADCTSLLTGLGGLGGGGGGGGGPRDGGRRDANANETGSGDPDGG